MALNFMGQNFVGFEQQNLSKLTTVGTNLMLELRMTVSRFLQHHNEVYGICINICFTS